ncbi:MAG: terminase TerL endonuclease subunit, partial [Clostridium sp.]
YEDEKYVVMPFFWIPEDNIFVKTDPAGNIKPDKEKSTEKIDGAVATIMALDRAIRHQGDGGSVYDNRGILIL